MTGDNPRFDDQPVLNGPTLTLRPLTASDHDGLFAAAANPEIWAGHPIKERYKPEVFHPYFTFLLEAGGTLAITTSIDRKIIGCSRYYSVAERPGSIGIGFTFLNNAYWGGATNFEVKCLMLTHAFATFPEVWFDIGPDNIRSQRATAKLGAEFVECAQLDLAGTMADWKCFRLTRSAWQKTVAAQV
ncbi:MAG: GNAT family N-acetyltransferase [Paracoccaceae bacterium]|nr:GNAT family N-acetyltransferase [Paracoccaceae bacterium]MDH5528399.1 GNAT family N-acetyltransferase [Paracoccaceae bacterium]